MGRNNYFQFKQFTIQQEKSAMKVGTDGVLLGGWVNTKRCDTVLDIGAGTGVIALMMAQRTNAKIMGIEIEENAALEAQQNVADSPWKGRVEIVHSSLQDFVEKQSSTFDLIVSNPPFFSNASKAGNKNRTLARHNDSLPFSELLSYSYKLLSAEGTLAVILPNEAAGKFETLARKIGLFLTRKMEVKPKVSKNVNRVLFEFSKTPKAFTKDQLIIYNEDGSYAAQYKELLSAFYLLF